MQATSGTSLGFLTNGAPAQGTPSFSDDMDLVTWLAVLEQKS